MFCGTDFKIRSISFAKLRQSFRGDIESTAMLPEIWLRSVLLIKIVGKKDVFVKFCLMGLTSAFDMFCLLLIIAFGV